MSGLLIDQKLDLLMNYTVFWAVDAVKAKFQSFMDKRKAAADKAAADKAAAAAAADTAAAAPSVNRSTSSAAEAATQGLQGVYLSHGTTTSSTAERRHLSRNQSEAGTMQGSSWVQSTHKFAKVGGWVHGAGMAMSAQLSTWVMT